MAEWSGEARSAPRHKRELRSAMKARGTKKSTVKNTKTKFEVKLTRVKKSMILLPLISFVFFYSQTSVVQHGYHITISHSGMQLVTKKKIVNGRRAICVSVHFF